MEYTEKIVLRVIEHHLGLSKGTVKLLDTFIDDLDCDSLDAIEIVMALEEEFDAEIDDTRWEYPSFTVNDAIALINSTK